jgi:hypothetical protein
MCKKAACARSASPCNSNGNALLNSSLLSTIMSVLRYNICSAFQRLLAIPQRSDYGAFQRLLVISQRSDF